MTTVYLVTTGAYSDYSVRAVCSTEPRAKGLAKHIQSEPGYCDYGGVAIEPFELDDMSDRLLRGERVFEVLFPNINSADIREITVTSTDYTYGEGTRSVNDVFRIDVWAKSAEGAAKIANEKRRQFLAMEKP